jgi:hypothetical protein
MAIKTKELEVPSQLPPARIYLDDLREIIEIFREARQYERDEHSPGSRETISFECGNKTCDTVDDLKKIGGTSSKFEVKVDNSPGCLHSLTVQRYGCTWLSVGLSRDGQWATYRKLEALLRHRKRWTATLRVIPAWVLNAVGLIFLLAIWVTPKSSPYFRITASVSILCYAVLTVLLITRLLWHTVVVLQDSSEPSGFSGILSRSVPQIVGAFLGAFLGVIGTLLVQYILHKYWPSPH